MAAGRGIVANVPEIKDEIARPDKREVVGLVDVRVRPAGDAGQRLAHVGHHRMLPGRKLVLAVQLHQPAAAVIVGAQAA